MAQHNSSNRNSQCNSSNDLNYTLCWTRNSVCTPTPLVGVLFRQRFLEVEQRGSLVQVSGCSTSPWSGYFSLAAADCRNVSLFPSTRETRWLELWTFSSLTLLPLIVPLTADYIISIQSASRCVISLNPDLQSTDLSCCFLLCCYLFIVII